MSKQVSVTSKESMWRERFKRQTASGKSIAAFCRDESIPAWAFHAWRAKLKPAAPDSKPATGADFIDLGAVRGISGVKSSASARFELRIDLGDGLLLTITKS